MKPVDGAGIPFYGFSFTPFSRIFESVREDSHLLGTFFFHPVIYIFKMLLINYVQLLHVDIIGVVAAKGELLEFKKGGETVPYIVVELDDLL